MLEGERLSVLEEVPLDESGREIADVVAADPAPHERELLQMAALRDLLLTEVREDGMQVLVHGAAEIRAETAAAIAAFREAEPVLLHLAERVPRIEEPIGNRPGRRLVAEKANIPDHPLVEGLVLEFLAVEEKEWVYEQRKVIYEGDVERAVRFQIVGIDLEEVAEVDVDGGVVVLFSNHHMFSEPATGPTSLAAFFWERLSQLALFLRTSREPARADRQSL